MKSYQIHLIRHGKTDSNIKGQYIGITDIQLSDQGKRELENLSKKYTYPKASLYFTSPLKRCMETFNILYPGVNPQIIEGLTECNFGEFEGKSVLELENNTNFNAWLMDAQNIAPKGGESGKEFFNRICKAFENIVLNMMKTGETQAVIVTHGGVIMTLLAAYGLPKAKSFEWMTDNGMGYSLRITPGLWMRDKVCEVYSKVPYNYKDEDDKIN